MKIRITFDFDERVRRALAHQIGGKISSYADCETWINSCIDATIAEVCYEYDVYQENRPRGAGKGGGS